MVTVAIDLSEAKVFLEEARREGGGRLKALWEWARGFAGRGLEALLRMELALLLEREQAAGVVNWRNGYRTRTLSLAGLGRLEFLVPRDRLSHSRSELLPFRKRRTEELEKLAAEMLCLPKNSSGMTCGWAYGKEATDGRVSGPAAARYPVPIHAASSA